MKDYENPYAWARAALKMLGQKCVGQPLCQGRENCSHHMGEADLRGLLTAALEDALESTDIQERES